MTVRVLAVPAVVALASLATYSGFQPLLGSPAALPQAAVAIRQDTANGTFDVTVGGRPFTSYQHGAKTTDKPFFYPVLAPNGARVNREYPMVPGVAGESSDHPHHTSVFFAYDEVNGTNFWNVEKSSRRIAHTSAAIEGSALVARTAWHDKGGTQVFDETKRVTFGGAADVFWMDHDLTLTARVPVTMGDTKEGAFAIRLNDTLKEDGGSGRYINAEGLETEKNVWGKTSPWVAIRGAIKEASGSKDVTVAIFAAPSGANFPPYWHARAYGLFAVNPFGRKAFDPAAPERVTRLATGDSVQVRYRLAVYDGQVDKARLDRDYATLR